MTVPIKPNGNGHGSSPHGGVTDPIVFNRLAEALKGMSVGDMDSLVKNITTLRGALQSQLDDPRRSIEDECGYPALTQGINAELFKQLYDREPIATRIVQVMPKESWQVQPLIYEDENPERSTPFEEAWDDLEVSLSGSSWHQDENGSTIWEHLLRADILSGIGQFGLLLLGVDDGKNLAEPVDGSTMVTTNVGTRKKPQYVNTSHLIVNDSPPHENDLKRLRELRKQVWNRESGEWEQGELEYTENEIAELSRVRTNNRRGFYRPENYDKIRDLSDGRQLWAGANDWESGWSWAWIQQPKDRIRYSGKDEPEAYIEISHKGCPACHGRLDAESNWKECQDYSKGQVEKWVNKVTTNRIVKQVNELVQGTDREYQPQGMGMPSMFSGASYATPSQAGGMASAMPGTDQQYFGVIFGGSEQTPPKPAKKGLKLLFLRSFSEDLVQVVRYEWNIRNPRFGMPVMYRVTLNDPREVHSGIGLPLATVFVHWSRVIHVADNLGSSEIFGVPRQRPVLNRLLDLRKLYSAGAEGYWKSCFTGLSFETHPQLGGDVLINTPALRDMQEQYINGLQRTMTTSGMSVKTLAPSVVDPTPHITMQIEAICIQLGCPVRVFKGSERGELASSQDDASWNDRLKLRQTFYITPRIIVPFIDRLIQIGVLPEPGQKGKQKVAEAKANGDKVENVFTEMSNGRRVFRGWIIYNKVTRNAFPPVGGGSKPPGSPTPGESPEGPATPGSKGDSPTPDSGGIDLAKYKKTLVTKAGYSVEWPDLDSNTDKDKAAIGLQEVQTIAAYVAGNCESMLSPHGLYTKVMGWTDEEAEQEIFTVQQAQENLDTMTQPAMVEGHPVEAPEGSAEKVTQDQQAKQAEEQMKIAGEAAKNPPAGPPVVIPPGGKAVHPASIKPPVSKGKPPTGNTYEVEEDDLELTDNEVADLVKELLQ